ncbi:hypothetical protein [Streptomyces sp. G45]|uniref:hypothetical protein n=1 Tax=Streptomyces sp. G45 TaxID=3406627 RepID=UPI003C23E0B4
MGAGAAARLLSSLGRAEPRLTLSAAEAARLAPLVEEWWAVGASAAQVRAALTQGLPERVYAPGALVRDRLERKRPSPPPAAPSAPVDAREAGAPGFVSAAIRGAELARTLLRGRGPVPA